MTPQRDSVAANRIEAMCADKWKRPLLYNLTSELIWPDVISRVRSHPHEVSWRDGNGGTALHFSCRFQNADDVVKEMVKSQDSAAMAIQDKFGYTPLHVACWNGSSSIVQILLDAHGTSASVVDNDGRTPLHLACSSCPPPTVNTIEVLLEANPDALIAKDSQGHTPLSLLCQRHDARLRIAMECIDSGADCDYVYDTVLKSFWNQLRLLLQAKVGTLFAYQDEWRLVHALSALPDCPRVLFDFGLKLHPDQVKEKVDGSLPLHLAAECPVTIQDEEFKDGYFICTLLSVYPAASRVSDGIGRLPLHIAIESGKSWDAVLKRLLCTFPSGLIRRDGKHFLLPSLLAALPVNDEVDKSATFQLTTVLELLMADPGAVQVRQ